MKRALAIMVALCTIGFAGFSQINIKGNWTTSLCILPSTTLTSTLSLTYNVAGFDVTGAFRFTGSGLDRVSFTTRGVFGPFSITNRVWFASLTPEYMGMDLVTGFDFGGIAIGMTVRHWDTDYNANFFDAAAGLWPFAVWYPDETPCTQTGSFGMMYIFSATVAPITVKASFVDCCEGIEFYQALITLKGIGLCCGITYDAELSFLKEKGFDYISFSGINVPICCGVSFDVTVTYGVDYKELEITPKFGGIVEGCFTVWGDAVFDDYVWTGIEIYGFKIRCTIADCNYIEFVNAFNVTEVNKKLAAADAFSGTCGEFELVKIGFCGAGCCGGKYDVTLRFFFGTGGGIFGMTRMNWTINIPVMTNFTLTFNGRVGVAGCFTQQFCFGWTFTF